MPGPSVHVPLIFGAFFLGFLLCWSHPMLRPLIFFWILAGLYLGREFTIYCHYAMPLALVAWFAVGAVLVKAPAIAKFGAAHVVVAAMLSLAVGAVQMIVAYRFARSANAESDS